MRCSANLTSVPTDFEKQSLVEALRLNGFNDKAPTFFSWLGVTFYGAVNLSTALFLTPPTSDEK